MTGAEKTAIETAYDYFKNPENYPLINVYNSNTPEENEMIAKTIYSHKLFLLCTGSPRNTGGKPKKR